LTDAERARVPEEHRAKSLVICTYCATVSEARANVREALGVLRGAAAWQSVIHPPLEIPRPPERGGGRSMGGKRR
jgi:hypothetical protein